MCYTLLLMNAPRLEWMEWAHFLRRHKLTETFLWFLEAGAPLSFLGAQFFYMSQPFFQTPHIHALAQILENDEETRKFIAFLKKDSLS